MRQVPGFSDIYIIIIILFKWKKNSETSNMSLSTSDSFCLISTHIMIKISAGFCVNSLTCLGHRLRSSPTFLLILDFLPRLVKKHSRGNSKPNELHSCNYEAYVAAIWTLRFVDTIFGLYKLYLIVVYHNKYFAVETSTGLISNSHQAETILVKALKRNWVRIDAGFVPAVTLYGFAIRGKTSSQLFLRKLDHT